MNQKSKGTSQDNLLENEAPFATSDDPDNVQALDTLGAQTKEEKRFLLLVERGDVASIKRMLDQYRGQPELLLLDCVDPLGRNGLRIAIENENYELIQLLLNEGVQVKDALLHAIKEEYVEAVEVLLEWEEVHHQPGTPYSWEATDRDTATFTPDITPLILAAHKNNYEIIKILLDRGATIPVPHDVKCGCDACVTAAAEDSLRHSRSRINAYRALASPSLICLSSKDPFLTAFELSWELRRLAKTEAEFRAEYNELRTQCQDFSTMLLSHARTSLELQTLLNYHKTDQGSESWEPGERQNLERLKMAIKYKQKKFVAHSSVQQLLAAMWYEGLPGFRRKTLAAQLIEVSKLGMMFPVYSLHYMVAPDSENGRFLKKPFVKFICHSASYVLFLTLLAAASQRLEFVVLEWFEAEWAQNILAEWHRKERGAPPSLVESAIVIYIFGWIWAEIKALWSDGLMEYVSDLWNVVDFITNNFYVAWIALRATAFFCVMRESWEGKDPYYPREAWDIFDPMLLSEGAFGAAMIFSFLKLVHMFSINPYLGPLQISLGRMIVDILKFFFIYMLVLFAFGCGLNQLLWYYADLEKAKCYSLPNNQPDYDAGDSCFIWRRFANLFETTQSLFWASFGLVELDAFDLTGIKGFTRFWGLLMFGSYSVINVIVLLNMLIAMMSSSYQIISERSDTEWKFARSKLWISYFDEGATVPPPFNIIPTWKSVKRMLCCGNEIQKVASFKRRGALQRYMHVTRLLVRRFVSAEEYRKQEQQGITEDDVNEIRQDISSFRYELIDVLKTNGMRTPNLQPGGGLISGRKGKVMERRLMKDFQIGVIENAIKEALIQEGEPKDVFSRIAKVIGGRRLKKDWNAMVRNASVKADPIGTKQVSLKKKNISARRRRIEAENSLLFSMDPERLAEYNPKLQEHSAATRVAYAKFKTKMLISQMNEEGSGSEGSSTATSPIPKTKVWTLSKKAKIRKLKDFVPAKTVEAKEEAIAQTASETPITNILNAELQRTESKKEVKTATCESTNDEEKAAEPKHPFDTEDVIEKAADDGILTKKPALPEEPEPAMEVEQDTVTRPRTFDSRNSSIQSTSREIGFTVVQVESSSDKGIAEQDTTKSDSLSRPSALSESVDPVEPVQDVTSKKSSKKATANFGSPKTSTTSATNMLGPSGRSAITGQARTGWI